MKFYYNFKDFKSFCHDDKHKVSFAVFASNLDLISVIVKSANENDLSEATLVGIFLKYSLAIRLKIGNRSIFYFQ